MQPERSYQRVPISGTNWEIIFSKGVGWYVVNTASKQALAYVTSPMFPEMSMQYVTGHASLQKAIVTYTLYRAMSTKSTVRLLGASPKQLGKVRPVAELAHRLDLVRGRFIH